MRNPSLVREDPPLFLLEWKGVPSVSDQNSPKQASLNLRGASHTSYSPRYCGSSPSSLSSYSTRNPDTVSEAETHETTKLLAVISVTDSEVATTGEKGVVSPVTVLPRGRGMKTGLVV